MLAWALTDEAEPAPGSKSAENETAATRYARERGWEVVGRYRIFGTWAGTLTDHPEAKRMLADMELEHIEAVVAADIGSFGLIFKDLLEFWFFRFSSGQTNYS